MELSEEQFQRYARHLILDEVGEEGQEKLLAARVLVIGAGGLGSPMLMYLAAAGVGTIGIIDHDTVDLTNLQRQIVHATERVGALKVESARATLAAVNDGIRIETHPTRLAPDNAAEIICYRCLFREPPPPGLVPRCEEAGILGAVAGVMGTLQAVEVLKELLGLGDSLDGTLLIYDALRARFHRIRIAKDPDCPTCGATIAAAP